MNNGKYNKNEPERHGYYSNDIHDCILTNWKSMSREKLGIGWSGPLSDIIWPTKKVLKED